MINLTVARLIWLPHTSDCRGSRAWAGPHGWGGPGWTLGSEGASSALCPLRRARALPFPPSLLALLLSFFLLGSLPPPFLPVGGGWGGTCHVGRALSRVHPPHSLLRPSSPEPPSSPPRASRPPSLLLLCVPSLVLKEFLGVPPTSSSCTSFENLARK